MRTVKSTTAAQTIIYELPLNEATRICLQLENLFQQFQATHKSTSLLNTKNALTALLKIWEVTDRPDIKSKLSQTLTQYAVALRHLVNSPQVQIHQLEKTLNQLDQLSNCLHTNPTRIGESLRENEFLYQIRRNLLNPGGLCDHRLPSYALWKKKSPSAKAQDLSTWIAPFRDLQKIVTALLKITRDSTPMQSESAQDGFYHQTLNSAINYQMVRVALPTQHNLYPEFSAGKHRITIRFVTPSYFGDGHPAQTQQIVHFQLSCCRL